MNSINIVPATAGGHAPNGWMRRPAPASQYTVLKLNLEQRRVLLEPDNGSLAIWFDTVAILIPFRVGQILEVSQVQS